MATERSGKCFGCVRQRTRADCGLAEMTLAVESTGAYVMLGRCGTGDDCPGGGSHEGQWLWWLVVWDAVR